MESGEGDSTLGEDSRFCFPSNSSYGITLCFQWVLGLTRGLPWLTPGIETTKGREMLSWMQTWGLHSSTNPWRHVNGRSKWDVKSVKNFKGIVIKLARFFRYQLLPEDKQWWAEPIFNRVPTTLSVLKGDAFHTHKPCRCTHLIKAVKLSFLRQPHSHFQINTPWQAGEWRS